MDHKAAASSTAQIYYMCIFFIPSFPAGLGLIKTMCRESHSQLEDDHSCYQTSEIGFITG